MTTQEEPVISVYVEGWNAEDECVSATVSSRLGEGLEELTARALREEGIVEIGSVFPVRS